MNFQCVMIMIIIMLLCHFVELEVEAQRSSPCHRKCKYVEAFQQANCEDRSLTAIPIECNAASYLSLRYNHITTIEPGLFKGFPFLKYLILSNNNISRVEANTFEGAPQLKSIKLLYNNLRTFDRNALNGTENRLRNIYLSRNSLRVIESGTFQLVPRLEVIDLQSNQLAHLTSDVFKDLKHLERLFLGMNKLEYLPDNIFIDLTSLVYLDLSSNFLSSFPPDLFAHMDQLRTVDASRNRLVNIGNILSLPNIRLDLRWNLLSQLGDVSLELLNNNVETLFLEGNLWDCTCSVEPLRIWYQQLSVSKEKGVKIDNPVCSVPTDLVNRTMNSLNVPLCMPNKSKETPTNSPVKNTDEAVRTDLKICEFQDCRWSETSIANDQMKIVIVVLVTIVVIVGVAVGIVKVVLSKRSLNETTTKTSLIDKAGSKSPRSPNSGMALSPEEKIMKKEDGSQSDKGDTNAKEDSTKNKANVCKRNEANESKHNETPVDEINETNASSSEDEEVCAKTPLIDKDGSKAHMYSTPGIEIVKEDGSYKECGSEGVLGRSSLHKRLNTPSQRGTSYESPVEERTKKDCNRRTGKKLF